MPIIDGDERTATRTPLLVIAVQMVRLLLPRLAIENEWLALTEVPE